MLPYKYKEMRLFSRGFFDIYKWHSFETKKKLVSNNLHSLSKLVKDYSFVDHFSQKHLDC